MEAFGTLLRRIPALRLAEAFDDIPFRMDGFIYGLDELAVTW